MIPHIDWQEILNNLYLRKDAEREQILAGDPRNFTNLVGEIDQLTQL